jgi:hypothetical protein
MALPRLDIPTYELIQPSTGKKVRYRPFLVKEHKVLLTMAEASEEEIARIVKEIVDACTFNQLKINDLPHFDIEYIFMMLRAKSISEKVDVVITCAKCNEKYDSSFNIEELKVVNDKNVTDKIMLTDTIGIQLKYPTFSNVIKIFESENMSVVFDLIKSCIRGVFDGENFYDIKEQTEDEVDEFLESLTKEQFSKIEEFFVNSPKIVQELNTECTNCGYKNYSRVEGLQNFFI